MVKESRFVILRHTVDDTSTNGDHFDLMLEHGDSLWTWAIDEFPFAENGQIARRLPDHRLVYLEFEGELTNGRGHVSQVESGSCYWKVIEDSSISVELQGQSMLQNITLAQNEDQGWFLIPKSPDSDP